MTDWEEVLERAAAWSEAGLGVAVATVASTWGSAPRPAGSHLAVNDRGEFVGSVSGGCIEAAVVGEALSAMRDGKARRLRYGVSDERAWELGLACGGTVEVHLEPGARRELYAELRRDLEARRPVVMATNLETGAARLVHPFEAAGTDPLAEAARDAAARDQTGTVPTADGEVLLRAYNPPVRVFVVGAVHVAQPLSQMVKLAGHDVLVVDPRRSFATGDRFPGVALSQEYPDEAFERVGLDRRSAVVALTHDPKIDEPALAAALRSEAFYLGALGSRKTQAARRERLARQGFSPSQLDRIHGPVGLPIGAVTPGEIATAILAEMVACLRPAKRKDG
ncbi:MAG TPA: XdhC/CoxI family protein [Anaeromyxobacteraceae bacterium]|nr:XdhC/CoxI family protein [Anaeromyxobacteraceae bacterium]